VAGTDGRRNAGDRRMVDAVAEIVKDIRNFAEDLVGEDGRSDEVAAAARAELGRRQQRCEGVARMPGAMGEADIGIVEIEISDHHAVGESR